MRPIVQPFFDPATWAVSYAVYRKGRPECTIVDLVLDYDPKSRRTPTASAIRKLLDLPGETRLFMCHDYPPERRGPAWETTVRDERNRNIHVHDGVTEAQFVAMRQARDATLAMPTLILPSVQVNIRAGELPPPEENGVRYLKIPLNAV